MADQEDKDQKTEEATPRRRSEARDRGQVAMSSELVAAIALIVGFASLALGGEHLANALSALVTNSISDLPTLGRLELSAPDFSSIVESAVTSVLTALGIVVLPAILIGALAGYGQVGFQVAPQALEIELSKVDPIKGVGRLFSMRALVRTLLAASKITLISGTVVFIAWQHVDEVIRMGTAELGPLLVGIGHLIVRCVAGALVVILALSLLDLFYQRFQHEKDLRMSKKEVKDDQRLSEGDPQIKARTRQIQREMATRRMMDDVPKSTVVITNPTHFAVALQYERDALGEPVRNAPLVTAKGLNLVAQRIKQIAAAADVVCYEDVPLARALYAQTRVGQEIPEELYAAVATVLGHVLRLRGEQLAQAAATS